MNKQQLILPALGRLREVRSRGLGRTTEEGTLTAEWSDDVWQRWQYKKSDE